MMGIIGLILGAVGLIGALVFTKSTIFGIIWIVLCIAGIVLSAIGLKKKEEKRGLSIAGLVVSIIGVILAIIFTLACATVDTAVNAVKTELEGQGINVEQAVNDINELAQQGENISQDDVEALTNDIANALNVESSDVSVEDANANLASPVEPADTGIEVSVSGAEISVEPADADVSVTPAN